MGVGRHEGYTLCLFGEMVRNGFGHVPYQVGSSLTQKAGWRDVDVRLILPDDEFTAYFGDATKAGWQVEKKAMWDMAWTMLGRHITQLPIDFQIQPMFAANGGAHEGPRSALFLAPERLGANFMPAKEETG